MNMIKKLPGYPLEGKRLAILMLLIYLALMLPIIYIGKWDAPQLDDYGYAIKTHEAWEETHNVFAVLSAAATQASESWQTWQGTFSSIFMMALNPAIFNYRGYKLVPALIILGMSLACFLLARLLLTHCLKKTQLEWISIGAIASILTIEKIYTIPSGLTWYNAAVHYMFLHSMMILLLCAVVRLVQAPKTGAGAGYLLAALILAIATGGTNYATSLMGTLLLTFVCLILLIIYRKRALISLLPLMVTVVCLILNVTAPGNAYRSASYVGWGVSPLQAILNSFTSAATYSIEWMDCFTALVLLMLVPIFWHILEEDTGVQRFRYPLPGLILILSFGILASGFTSSWYSLGHAGLSRLQNVIRMSYQILLILNEGYFIGWILRKKREKAQSQNALQQGGAAQPMDGNQEKAKRSVTLPAAGFVLLMILMYCTVHFHHNPLGTFTTFSAWYYLQNDEAAWYYEECMQRMQVLESSRGQDVVLTAHAHQPWLFFIEDISEDPGYWLNAAMSSYYGVATVRLESSEE